MQISTKLTVVAMTPPLKCQNIKKAEGSETVAALPAFDLRENKIDDALV